MPYKKTQDNGIDFTGKVANMVLNFEKWYSEDLGSNPKIQMGAYAVFITMPLAYKAKEKWINGFFTKSKAKAIDDMIEIHPNGSMTLRDLYATMDFLAENLSEEEIIEWSKEFRNNIIQQYKHE